MEGYGSRKYFFSSGQWSKNHIFNRGQPQKDVVKHWTKNSQLVRVENFHSFVLAGIQGPIWENLGPILACESLLNRLNDNHSQSFDGI